LEEGLDLFTLKEQMGHTRITTTMTYVHIAQVIPKVAFSPLERLHAKLKMGYQSALDLIRKFFHSLMNR